jgi:hypothetical protein
VNSHPTLHLRDPPKSIATPRIGHRCRDPPTRATLSADEQPNALPCPAHTCCDSRHRRQPGISGTYNFYAFNSFDVGHSRQHGVCERFRFSVEVEILNAFDTTNESIIAPSLEQRLDRVVVLQAGARRRSA